MNMTIRYLKRVTHINNSQYSPYFHMQILARKSTAHYIACQIVDCLQHCRQHKTLRAYYNPCFHLINIQCDLLRENLGNVQH